MVGRSRHLAALSGVVLAVVACAAPRQEAPSTAASIDTATAMTRPTPLAETSVESFVVDDFEAVHSASSTDGGALILGGLPIATPPPDVSSEIGAFLGRWAGAGIGPPIKGDWKYVLAVTDITPSAGSAVLWAGTNLQFPAGASRVHFRVTGTGAGTAIEWEQTSSGSSSLIQLRHGAASDLLEGGGTAGDSVRLAAPVVLRKGGADAVIYRDYAAHLADLGITWRPHDDPALAAFGGGSLVYVPPGYDDDPSAAWPLIVFLHGSGDRGDNGLVIAQNSPFRFVTGGGALDAIVVAPLLGEDQSSFPEAYLDGVVDDALARYRVDRANVTVTGLSMGGEATYRLARHRSELFAAAAILCGFETGTFPEAYRWGYKAIAEPRSAVVDMPILVIHGRDDTIVPLAAADAAVEALRKAGVDVTFDVLDDHDHDVWTTTYSDPAFYRWLLDQRREPS